MRIEALRINHLENPIGYDISYQTFSWQYADIKLSEIASVKTRLEVAEDLNFSNHLYDSGYLSEVEGSGYELQLKLQPRTRYYWRVTGADKKSEYPSETAFFETGKLEEPWQGTWIAVKSEGDREDIANEDYEEKGILELKERISPILRKSFTAAGEITRARMYVTGLGLYECTVNGTFINDGYLQPGFNNYNYWLQYQTYDITSALLTGDNVIGFYLGAGWFKGRFGVSGGFEDNFGKNYQLLCEIHLDYADGSHAVVASDESFRWKPGPVRFDNIYDGEVFDARHLPEGWENSGFDDSEWNRGITVREEKDAFLLPEKLTERTSVPVIVKEVLTPAKILHTPSDKTVIDLGQNISGWLVLNCCIPKGVMIRMKFAEHMQDLELYRKNLLTARQEFCYISDGERRFVRPHFTYYGFRYVQIEGLTEDQMSELKAWNLYSDLKTTGSVTTGNPLVNQFISNAFWSQRDNFLDHPTDCPQRAERLGWTGDAQMYCGAASYFMDTQPFFRKYLKDVFLEQEHKDGMVPFIVPKIAGRGFEDKEEKEECSAAWSDVAVIIPWKLYLFYGDKNLLREQYAGMKAWVEYVIRKDQADGEKYLWQTGFHFGDWLALDNLNPGPFGKTDIYYVASCYYFYSLTLTAKAADVLGYQEDFKRLERRAHKVKQAILNTYFDKNSICMQDTQTGYVLALSMDIVSGSAIPENGKKLTEKIEDNDGHLDTGFVGTAYLCQALTKAGYQDTAYRLLLNEEYPGWLYQVKQNATTVWESWDCLDEEGRMKSDSSMNHYTFGAITEWMFCDVCGINPMEDYPGGRKMRIAPKVSGLLKQAEASLCTMAGSYRVAWEVQKEDVIIDITVPQMGSARVELEDGRTEEITGGNMRYIYKNKICSYR